jgi:hypothetical protein
VLANQQSHLLAMMSMFLTAMILFSWLGAAEAKDTPLEALRPFPEQGVYVRDGKSYQCGLYPGGKNQMPAEHRKAGERLAAGIVPDRTGKIVMTAVGHSNPSAYFGSRDGGYGKFLASEIKKGTINPQVELQSMCFGGVMSMSWANNIRIIKEGKTTSNISDNIIKHLYKDTQVLLLLTSSLNATREKSDPKRLTMTFEERTEALKRDMVVILQFFAERCPNLKLAYVGCDTWRGNVGLEPIVWEEAFAFKRLIEEQIEGKNPELAYEGPQRKVPWLAWGGYIWENNPPKERFSIDGVHPSKLGIAFARQRWHETLSGDSTAIPWLLPKKR